MASNHSKRGPEFMGNLSKQLLLILTGLGKPSQTFAKTLLHKIGAVRQSRELKRRLNRDGNG